MTRPARARIFRSTQTAPNAGSVRDLATAFGAAANTNTSAAFAVGDVTKRFTPNGAAVNTAIPNAPSTATGNGWRDTTAENANERVRYAAGTWTISARLNKTVMAVDAPVTVRLTAIVYQVTSAGAHVAEMGRIVLPDALLTTVGVTVTTAGSFTTGAAVEFPPGNKVQVEVYVQNIVLGDPAAALSAYTVAFVVDETSPNGASFTAQPTYNILYTMTQAVTAAGLATIPLGPAPDWPLNTPTKVIAGVTRDSIGAVVGSATVKLIRQSDDVRVASSTSHPTTGAYSFTRGGDDPNTYRVVATKADVPEIHGVSDVLTPA